MKYLNELQREVCYLMKDYPIILPIIIALASRLFIVLSADFPLNDGGMFYTMAQEIKDSNFFLPLYTSYNHSQIPFAYPPLTFYLVAFFTKILPISTLDLFRFFPLTISLLTIPVVYLIAKELFDKRMAILTAFVFALLPRSFIWIIMGGGVARSAGVLFCLTTILFGAKLYKSSKFKDFISACLFATATLLSHLEWYFFSVLSLLILLLFFKRKQNIARSFILINFFSLAFSSVWWLTIIKRHGIEPFAAFSQAGFSLASWESYFQLITLNITDEPFLTIWGVLTLMGLVLHFFEKKYWLILWFLTPIILSPRTSPNLLVLPSTFLIVTSVDKIVLPSIVKSLGAKSGKLKELFKFFRFKLFFSLILLYFLFSSLTLLPLDGLYSPYFNHVTEKEREAFEWIRENTPLDGKFLLLTETALPTWGMDPVSEWFPAITQRASISTPQGAEWIKNGKFFQKVKLYTEIKNCYDKDLDCVENTVSLNGDYFTHILLYKPSLGEKDNLFLIRQELFNSKDYIVVYDNPDLTIFSKRI